MVMMVMMVMKHPKMNSLRWRDAATVYEFWARKVVFIPDLIPQPDWDKYH